MQQKSSLTNKSDILVESAKLLNDRCLFAPVPHCSYYSCVQLMKHIWLYSLKKTEKDLREQCKNTNTGSHEVLINTIGRLIGNKTKNDRNNTDFRMFNNKINQLKILRIEADYQDILCDYNKSKESIELSKQIIPILKKY